MTEGVANGWCKGHPNDNEYIARSSPLPSAISYTAASLVMLRCWQKSNPAAQSIQIQQQHSYMLKTLHGPARPGPARRAVALTILSPQCPSLGLLLQALYDFCFEDYYAGTSTSGADVPRPVSTDQDFVWLSVSTTKEKDDDDDNKPPTRALYWSRAVFVHRPVLLAQPAPSSNNSYVTTTCTASTKYVSTTNSVGAVEIARGCNFQ